MAKILTHFIVWAPDRTDAGAVDRRYVNRPSHLEGAIPLIKNGTIRIGGGLLSPENRQLIGSCFIIEAESLEAARIIVENDIYYTADVWDKGKLQVLPVLLATPLPPVAA